MSSPGLFVWVECDSSTYILLLDVYHATRNKELENHAAPIEGTIRKSCVHR